MALWPTMTTKAKTESVRLRVTQDELDWLREEAARQERTVASLLRVVLRHYLDTKA